jgi:chondroitin synthase
MNILNEAIKTYREKNYAKALDLFEQAELVYGSAVVKVNIHLCKKALEQQQKFIAAKPQSSNAPIPISKGDTTGVMRLDPATRYMLAAMGQIDLTEEQKQQCLQEHKQLTSRKSEDAEVKPVNPIPADWPKDLVLAPLPESTNDFLWHYARKAKQPKQEHIVLPGLSVIIPTFNRSKILDITLACLANQETKYPFEVVVADDGSKESVDMVVRKYEAKLDIKYVRQKDYGYQLCAVRNLGLRTAKYEFVAILDCDMAPNPKWVDGYMRLLVQDDDVALIGPRKYVDTSSHTAEEYLVAPNLIKSLPEVLSPDTMGRSHVGSISVDWRLDHFRQTKDLRLCDTPFRFFSGGNVAFARKWLKKAGWFDEDFTHWGGEDNEFGYRLYRAGCFFRVVWGALAYHQEPPGKENETDRAAGKKITINIVREKVPYYYRNITPLQATTLHKKPLVSIYIPAHNCADHIVRCVDSALNQTLVDLEVCICNDGSTDNTFDVLAQHYGYNPRVRIQTQANGGIGRASNTAVRMARGYYIGQLDSDDYLEPDAVELCLKEFLAERKLACVYTTNRNVKPDGTLIAKGYNWPVFSREKLTTAMIAHHFRMFTARAWNLTEGFKESIVNAIDYDMYLKLSEIGPFKHINKISYNRVLHGENTSIKNIDIQKKNHFFAVNQSLARQNVAEFKYLPANPESKTDRAYVFLCQPVK